MTTTTNTSPATTTLTGEAALRAELEAMKAENEALKAKAAKGKGPGAGVSFKVSEKGGLSVYGLGRFPVTLYKGQWNRLIGVLDALKVFIAENDAALKDKPE
jgi:hypothetical protein